MGDNPNDTLGQREAVVIDIDDTLIDIGGRRVELFRRHFPHAAANAEEMRFDVALKRIGPRTAAPAKAYLADFADPAVVREMAITEIEGAVAAVSALESAGLEVILLSSRPGALRGCTLADLASVGLHWEGKRLLLYESPQPMDPADESAIEAFKASQLKAIKRDVDIIAVVGDSATDVIAAFQEDIPAILLCPYGHDQPTVDFTQHRHVGFQECNGWPRALVEIGTYRTGEKQLSKLRDSFTDAYTSWLTNLNHLCAIDVTVASVLAALAGRGMLEASLSWTSRLLAAVPLVLALTALALAIRAFTSKYSSGEGSSRAIVTRFGQALAILLDIGGPLTKARTGDAIHEYATLRERSPSEQASAHRQFFYSRYKTNNPGALLNLRMFEMRSVNYVRAYAEHLASRTLIWAATALVAWVIGVSFLDPAVHPERMAAHPAAPDTVMAAPLPLPSATKRDAAPVPNATRTGEPVKR